MIMKAKIYLVFILLTANVFSQEVTKTLTFKKTASFFLNEVSYLVKTKKNIFNKIPVLSASVRINNSEFSVLLLNYNTNNSFLDSIKPDNKVGLDGILISDYKRTKNIKRFKTERRYFKTNFPFSVNGVQYELSDFKKNKDVYQAKLTIAENKSHYIVENKNGVYVDKLPNLELPNFTKTKNINLKEIPLGKELIYFNFFSDEILLYQFTHVFRQLKTMQILYPKLKIINICILKNRNYLKAIAKKFRIQTNNLFCVEANSYDKILKVGYNDNLSNGILFNNSGKVVLSFLNYKSLKKYIGRLYPNSNKGKIKIPKDKKQENKKATFTYKKEI